MNDKQNWRGNLALMAGHCAGMVDLVALPIWMGVLIAHYGFDPQQAGGLITLFLAAAVAASALLAPRMGHLRGRGVTTIGFALAAAAFVGLANHSAFGGLAFLHVVAGSSAGSALSVVHGSIGRSTNPHRLFAMLGLALGLFAIAFVVATPPLVTAFGGQALFYVLAGVMATAAFVQAIAFSDGPAPVLAVRPSSQPLPPGVWAGVAGVACMAMLQAMTFSFVERIGTERFGAPLAAQVLIAVGLVNLFPGPLAAWLEKRLPASRVVLIGPLVQAALTLTVTQALSFPIYAAAAAVFVSVMIFTHAFAFGWLSRLDPSGRTVAATPAMLMVGAAIGPIAGGTLVKYFGYASLGAAAVVIAAVAVACFAVMGRAVRPQAAHASGEAGQAAIG